MDYQGIATLIAAVTAAVISVLSAIQSFRNGKQIAEVHVLTNALTDKRAVEARASGVSAGTAAEMLRQQEAERVRHSGPNV